MDGKIGDIKCGTVEISRIIADLWTVSSSHPALKEELALPLHEMTEKLLALQEAADYFQTSQTK